ncbi:MAG TPA: helix-turn-helix domain-containing protein [Rhizomicrobium sp.]|nr:helix-turn-helix domain-containing protein [Rhizomicrobium sp.]
MRWESLDREHCSLARALAVLGDRWTLLVLRESFMGVRRFEDFEKGLKIARRVLSERLRLLVAEDVLRRVPYQERPTRYEYRLTEKGLALYPAILSLVHWGDRFYAGDAGPPVLHTHLACGHDFHSVLTCSECGEALDARAVSLRAGPGAAKTARRSRSKTAARP